LRGKIAALDTTIRIFDPSQVLTRIRPVVKLRNRTVSRLKHGEFGSMVFTVLRDSSEPLSIGEIAVRLRANHGIDITTPAKRGAIVSKIRVHLSAQKPGTIDKGRSAAGWWFGGWREGGPRPLIALTPWIYDYFLLLYYSNLAIDKPARSSYLYKNSLGFWLLFE
jgi:hypothetical protein